MRYSIVLSTVAIAVAGMALSCATADEPKAEPLFVATARELGFFNDATFYERQRLPSISIVRMETGKPHGSGFGHILFTYGSISALCQNRGFTHVVILEEGPVLGGEEGAAWGLELVVGFTNSANPDVATEFPDYFDPATEYETTAASFLLGVFGRRAAARRTASLGALRGDGDA